MSVTVADLLKLPSLRQAKVVGGRGGLGKIVSSISVLESTDPEVLVKEVFPRDRYSGGEIVITGFLNCVDDVDLQCANLQRLIEGGEVGLVLYYVGIYLPAVDRRLIDMADRWDFVLICMPEGRRELRYSDLITDVTECIYRDRATGVALVSNLLARISSAPHHQQTVGTAIRMLSAELSCSVALCTHECKVLNLASWPSGMEDAIRRGVERCPPLASGELSAPCPFLPDASLYRVSIRADLGQPLQLMLIKEGEPLSQQMVEQAADVTRICVNIWGQQHGEVAVHELVRAILQDEPMKMRRLADIFRIDVASIHEMWVLNGNGAATAEWLLAQADTLRDFLTGCVDTVVIDRDEDKLLLFLSEPESLREAERRIELILELAWTRDETATLTRYGDLRDTGEVRRAYLCHQTCLADAKKLFPRRKSFCQGETEYAQSCRELIGRGEEAVRQCLSPLQNLQTDKEEGVLLETLSVYLLDGSSSVTQTAQLLHLHKNTIKYRIQRVSNLLGYRPDKMPETVKLYQAVAVRRLLFGET